MPRSYRYKIGLLTGLGLAAAGAFLVHCLEETRRDGSTDAARTTPISPWLAAVGRGVAG